MNGTNYAHVLRIKDIEPHPNPEVERLEVIVLSNGTKLVTGKHYRIGDLGIHLMPGAAIPGWLAEQLWLVGKKRATAWFEVRTLELKGTVSPGLWCGRFYKNDTSQESVRHWQEMKERSDVYASEVKGDTVDAEGFIRWPFWRDHWTEGYTLDGYLGIIPAWKLSEGFAAGGMRPMASQANMPGTITTFQIRVLPSSTVAQTVDSHQIEEQ